MADRTDKSYIHPHSNRSTIQTALLLGVLLAVAPLGAPAFADEHITAPKTPEPARTAASKGAASAGDATASSSVTTGSINQEPTFAQRMSECMEIWDRGTHMTKKQWRRSCQTTLQSLKWD